MMLYVQKLAINPFSRQLAEAMKKLAKSAIVVQSRSNVLPIFLGWKIQTKE